MTSQRKKSGKQRADPDGPQSYNIRFDYSDIYLDNEDLEEELEDQASALNKEKLRMTVETEANLKTAKKEADKMLHLKNAIKNRDPNESSNRISKSGDLKRGQSSQHLCIGSNGSDTKLDEQIKNKSAGNEGSKATESIGESKSENDNDNDQLKNETKQMNNLTKFLISFHKFKTLKKQTKKDEPLERRASLKEDISKTTAKSKRKVPKRPATVHAPRSHTVDDIVGGDRSAQYGIHVKKDHSRSRRILEEISRLEQDSKFGNVNKYEERRKRLLASCKDTKSTDERITVFLKEVDEFKKISSDENSLERVLMRSKSATYRRNPTTCW